MYTIWREGEREGESGILHDVATATIHLLAIYLPQSSLEVGLVRTHWMVRCVAPNKLELIKNRKDAFLKSFANSSRANHTSFFIMILFEVPNRRTGNVIEISNPEK